MIMQSSISPEKSKKKIIGKKVKVKRVSRFTKEELNEEFDTILTTRNPYMSENCVEFDRKMKSFKAILDFRKPVVVHKNIGTMKRKLPKPTQILYGEDKEEEDDDEVEDKLMRNKFNFRSVGCQTTHTHPSGQDAMPLSMCKVPVIRGQTAVKNDRKKKDHSNQTDRSLFPVLKFKNMVSRAVIIAAYQKHEKKEQKSDKYAWVAQALRKMSRYVGKKSIPFQDSNRRYLRICERMVDQNLSQAHLDFSYYDDPRDEVRPNCGSLLPLWNFYAPKKGLSVTDVAWSNNFVDMFAVAYRSLKEYQVEGNEDDMGLVRETGCLCVFSLKGPTYPEKIILCPFAVRCLSFHPIWTHLLATGSEGGFISVYDLRMDKNCPAGVNKITEKILHQDTVSSLEWLPDSTQQKFCTVSTDGKVLKWQFLLNDLSPFETVTTIRSVEDWPGSPPKVLPERAIDDLDWPVPEDMGMKMVCTSFSINPDNPDLFMVATEHGDVYECSFNAKLQQRSYQDHKTTVSRVHWNSYHPRVFLTCSDDMTVRIWDHSLSECVFEIFFDDEVKDSTWAPFSSTSFAVISGNAKVLVYDLSLDKNKAIGEYSMHQVGEDVQLTTLCFHPSRPVLLIGDDRGRVMAFKLSPNLRSSMQARLSLDESSFMTAELNKMEKLLAPSKGRQMVK